MRLQGPKSVCWQWPKQQVEKDSALITDHHILKKDYFRISIFFMFSPNITQTLTSNKSWSFKSAKAVIYWDLPQVLPFTLLDLKSKPTKKFLRNKEKLYTLGIVGEKKKKDNPGRHGPKSIQSAKMTEDGSLDKRLSL